MFVGSGRSGTTLFGLIFDTHPELAVAHEAHFVAAIAVQHRSLLEPDGFDTERFLQALAANSNFRRLGMPTPDVERQIRDTRPESYADAVRSVFELFATRHGKRLYGDKTPGYVNHLDLLGGLFPEAKFVHILRDGRDVALAYLDRPEWGPRTVAEAAYYWRTRVQRGHLSGRRLGQERYREVRYEALIDDPEATVSEVCTFLGLGFAPEMLSYHEKGVPFAASTRDPEAFASSASPITKGLRDWREQMTRGDVVLFEAIAGDVLADLGYEPSGLTPNVGTRLRVGAAGARWQLRRVGARLRRSSRRYPRLAP
jgi:hypothetical protein